MDSGELESYWVMSGSSKILGEYLKASEFGLDELTSRWVSSTDLSSTYSQENPLSLFFQTGYLTIREYDGYGAYRLGIPNEEVQTALAELLIPEFTQTSPRDVTQDRITLTKAIMEGDVDKMLNTLKAIVSTVPYHQIDIKAQEKHIHLCMYVIFMMLGTNTKCELSHSAGRVDMVAETPWRVYVFEFKIDGSPAEALRQIDEEGYAIPWEAGGREVIKIGVNFSSPLRTIDA